MESAARVKKWFCRYIDEKNLPDAVKKMRKKQTPENAPKMWHFGPVQDD
jgi:hypothetical protein